MGTRERISTACFFHTITELKNKIDEDEPKKNTNIKLKLKNKRSQIMKLIKSGKKSTLLNEKVRDMKLIKEIFDTILQPDKLDEPNVPEKQEKAEN